MANKKSRRVKPGFLQRDVRPRTRAVSWRSEGGRVGRSLLYLSVPWYCKQPCADGCPTGPATSLVGLFYFIAQLHRFPTESSATGGVVDRVKILYLSQPT